MKLLQRRDFDNVKCFVLRKLPTKTGTVTHYTRVSYVNRQHMIMQYQIMAFDRNEQDNIYHLVWNIRREILRASKL